MVLAKKFPRGSPKLLIKSRNWGGPLAEAGIVRREAAEWHTTEKWAQALMRAETKITVDYIGEAIEDPRIPVTYALLDLLGANVPEDDLKAFVDALVPLELDEEEALEPETEELEH